MQKRTELLDYHWPDANRENKDYAQREFPSSFTTKLTSLDIASHDKHFIVMSHSSHVTTKWVGKAATQPTPKGGRTNVGKARLLTGKMRED